MSDPDMPSHPAFAASALMIGVLLVIVLLALISAR